MLFSSLVSFVSLRIFSIPSSYGICLSEKLKLQLGHAEYDIIIYKTYISLNNFINFFLEPIMDRPNIDNRPVTNILNGITNKVYTLYNEILTNNYSRTDNAFIGLIFIILGLIGLQLT